MTEQAAREKTILVVDDEPDVCLYLSRLFTEHGYAVMSAADGEEASKKVQERKPDLITLDLSMPGKSGVRFYREIRSRPDWSQIPVVFVTAVSGPGGNAAEAERFYSTRRQVPPPDGFIAKPINPEEIVQLVRKLVRV